jgi:hypothetical protein
MQGSFKAKAIDFQLGVSNNGNEQVALMFQIIGGDHDGKRISWFGSFTEKTTERTLDSLRHCGWAGDDITNLDDVCNNEVEIVVEEEQGEDGKVRSRVRWVNRLSALKLKNQLNPAAAAAFAAKLRGRAVAHKQKYGAVAAPSQPQRQPANNGGDDWVPPDDDDINF